MSNSKITGVGILTAAVGYVVGKAAGEYISKRRQKKTETPIERATRMLNQC